MNNLNDLDSDLINVYKMIRDFPDELINFFTKKPAENNRIPINLTEGILEGQPLPASKELHTYFKNEFIPQNLIEKAGRWYYLNRTSYSGIMNSQNMYWGYGDKFSMQPKNWPANIFRASQKLQSVKLTCDDFESVINQAPDGSFLFIDPPYFNADQDKFYNCIFSKQDHYRLENVLRKNADRLYFLITYDNTEEVRGMYCWANEIHDKEWNYCIQRTDDQKNGTKRKGKRYKGKEIFILNYNSNQIDLKEFKQMAINFG